MAGESIEERGTKGVKQMCVHEWSLRQQAGGRLSYDEDENHPAERKRAGWSGRGAIIALPLPKLPTTRLPVCWLEWQTPRWDAWNARWDGQYTPCLQHRHGV